MICKAFCFMPGPNSETWRGRIDVCQGIICNQWRIRSLVYSSCSILNWQKIPRVFRTQKLTEKCEWLNVNKVEREMCRSTSQPFNQPKKLMFRKMMLIMKWKDKIWFTTKQSYCRFNFCIQFFGSSNSLNFALNFTDWLQFYWERFNTLRKQNDQRATAKIQDLFPKTIESP